MISLHFSLRNPFNSRFSTVRFFHGKTPLRNKFWEIEITKCGDIIAFEFEFTFLRDHPGMRLNLSLMGYSIGASIYDNRHRDMMKI